MRATFHSMETARRALFTAQTQLDITSHNIANVETEGYTRQRAELVATAPAEQPFLWETQSSKSVGSGVDVTGIESLRDRFLDAQFLREESRFGRAETRSELLEQIEGIFNEPGDATLKAEMEKFWASLQDLSQNPASMALRETLKNRAVSMTDFFNELSDRLKKLQGMAESTFQGSIQDQIDIKLREVNEKGREVADLNVKINAMEVAGFNANDLTDRRNKLVEEIGANVNVEKIISSENGHLILRMGTHTFVQHGEFLPLFYKQREKNGPGIIVGAATRREGKAVEPAYPAFSQDETVAVVQSNGVETHWNDTVVVTQTAARNEKFSYLTFNPLGNTLESFGIRSGTFTLNGREYELNAETMKVEGFVDYVNSLDAGVVASLNEAGQILFKAQASGEAANIDFKDGTSNIALILDMRDQVKGQDSKFSFAGKFYQRSSNLVTDALKGVVFELKKSGVSNVDLRPVVTAGKLKGLMEIKEGSIADLVDRLDELAYRLVNEINFAHQRGFGLDGETGRNFFKPFKIINSEKIYSGAAGALKVDEAILADVSAIGAARGIYTDPTQRLKASAGKGNGDNLLDLAAVRFKRVFDDGESDFDDFYDEMVATYSTESADAQENLDYESSLREQITKRRESVSGVSLDEELANTIKYQQAYNAAARMVRMVDELIQAILDAV